MYKSVKFFFPFLGMFLLTIGSVILSCATTGNWNDTTISLNTGKAADGKIHTNWVLGEIRSVIVVNYSDRSEKIELSPDEWQYDFNTTELSVLRELPFKEYIVSIEAHNAGNSFILTGIKEDEDILVIINNRVGIEGYDFSFIPEKNLLTFRNDIDLNETEWRISYSTPEGGASIGEWKPESQDQISYLEAEHRRQSLESFYEKQDTFWFMDYNDSPGTPPQLVKRRATSEELSSMKSVPISVWKIRFDADFSELTDELGFPISLPEEIRAGNSPTPFRVLSKAIEEYSDQTDLIRKLHVSYNRGDMNSKDDIILDIILSPAEQETVGTDKTEGKIDEKIINLGVPVQRIRQWGMKGTQDIEKKPEIVSLTSWTWNIGPVQFHLDSETSDEEMCREIIQKIILSAEK